MELIFYQMYELNNNRILDNLHYDYTTTYCMQKRVQKKKVKTLDIFWCLVQAAFNQWLLELCSIHASRRIPGDFYICLVEYKPNEFAYTFI
jgi:hypothetical protein